MVFFTVPVLCTILWVIKSLFKRIEACISVLVSLVEFCFYLIFILLIMFVQTYMCMCECVFLSFTNVSRYTYLLHGAESFLRS